MTFDPDAGREQVVQPPSPPGPPSWRPTRKVTAGSVAAAAWTVVVLVLAEVGVSLSPPLVAAVTALIGAAAGYWTREGA